MNTLSERKLNQFMQQSVEIDYKKERQMQIEAEDAAEKEILRPWDANEMYKIAKQQAKSIVPDLSLDGPFKEFIEKLSLYFSNDPRFEDKGYGSLNKGLFVTGLNGRGKTFGMSLFSFNKRNCFLVKNAMVIADAFQQTGIDGISNYFTQIPVNTFYKGKYFNQKQLGLLIDDFGFEDVPAVHFGQKVNVLEKIICYRYDQKAYHHLTHFTSNLNADEIEARYGTRVRSRLREMCNFIILDGPDRRK
jgi:hypothetical protein